MDSAHVAEDEAKWEYMYEDMTFLDDMSTLKLLEKDAVIKARQLETAYSKSMIGLY